MSAVYEVRVVGEHGNVLALVMLTEHPGSLDVSVTRHEITPPEPTFPTAATDEDRLKVIEWLAEYRDENDDPETWEHLAATEALLWFATEGKHGSLAVDLAKHDLLVKAFCRCIRRGYPYLIQPECILHGGESFLAPVVEDAPED